MRLRADKQLVPDTWKNTHYLYHKYSWARSATQWWDNLSTSEEWEGTISNIYWACLQSGPFHTLRETHSLQHCDSLHTSISFCSVCLTHLHYSSVTNVHQVPPSEIIITIINNKLPWWARPVILALRRQTGESLSSRIARTTQWSLFSTSCSWRASRIESWNPHGSSQLVCNFSSRQSDTLGSLWVPGMHNTHTSLDKKKS